MTTRREKRLLVLGRLAQGDAATLSDRAIARELGVSQPFVGALRRLCGRREQKRRDAALKQPAAADVDQSTPPAVTSATVGVPGFWDGARANEVDLLGVEEPRQFSSERDLRRR